MREAASLTERFKEEFSERLETATSRVSEEYFYLPVHLAKDEYRERVYCYELYHQLRQDWPEVNYRLNGEIDKAKHPYFQDLSAYKPDFLVHIPGSPENYLIIEVKRSNTTTESLIDDLKKLHVFRQLLIYPYQRAILLIYGAQAEDQLEAIEKSDAVEVLQKVANKRCAEASSDIEIWLHVSAGDPAYLAKVLSP